MSSEEVIQSWKDEDEDEQTRKEAKPENPAGVQPLSDEDLEHAEGGLTPGSCLCCSC